MPRFLVAADSVHTAAAACDYLEGRLDPDDEVIVVSVVEPEADPRDGGDAANVAAVRLGALATVTEEALAGTPADVLVDLAVERDVDELVIGARAGAPGADAAVGSTATAILSRVDRPVVVVPVPDLD